MEVSAPHAIILDGEQVTGGDWQEIAARAIEAEGWRVHRTAPDPYHAPGLELPALVLFAADLPALMVDEVRRTSGAASVAVTASDLVPAHCDDHVPATADQDVFAALARQWQPRQLGAATERLSAVFGNDAIAPMLVSFADLLEEGLHSIDQSDARDLAHRIAGIAGTLGFAELSRGWLAISEGDRSGARVSRHATRIAIGSIRRRHL